MNSPAPGPIPRPTVFVVDDDASFLDAISRLVRAGGYKVQTYASATEFLQSARTDTPGCVLLDLNMPGPSGLDLQRAIARSENPLPIVFFTGKGDIPSSVQAMRAGAEDFLTKPAKQEVLFAAILLDHVLTGQLNKQIAADLDARLRTIKAHRANLMAKLQVHSVAELAHLAHEAGISTAGNQ